MNWLVFSGISATCWALVQTVDKTLIENEAPSYRHYLFVSGLASVPVVLLGPIFLHASVVSLPLRTILLSIVAGICYFIGNAFFFYALTVLDASIATAALAAIPACAAIVSWLALGESLRFLPALGLSLITVGVIVMNARNAKSAGASSRRKAWLALIGAIAVLVAEYVIEGYAVEKAPSTSVFYWGRVGVVVAVAALGLCRPREAGEAVRWLIHRRGTIVGFLIGNEALDMVGIACLIAAYARGPVGLATGIAYANPVLVFLLTVVVDRLRPGTIPSEGDMEHFKRRALGVTVVVSGVILASL
jgi:drug/metabolite transporter (DMT)-like permease